MPVRYRAPKPPRNLPPPVPVNPRRVSPLAPTVLPTSLVLVSAPPKLPPRTVGNDPYSVILTVPTVGPLPPPPATIVRTVRLDPTVVPLPRRPVGFPVPPRAPGGMGFIRPPPFIRR